MLELILGPMYSGKTTLLLKKQCGNTLIINHSFDTRTDGVKTHDGVEVAAQLLGVVLLEHGGGINRVKQSNQGRAIRASRH